MFVVHALVIDPIKTDKTTAIIDFCPRIKIISVMVRNSITTRFFFSHCRPVPLFGPLKDGVFYNSKKALKYKECMAISFQI